MIRRRVWETVAIGLICAGVVMLTQPFWLLLYSYSFATTLLGVMLFIIASRLPE
jgi:uncharacterized membrane protein YjjP (DUF1212 family)